MNYVLVFFGEYKIILYFLQDRCTKIIYYK